MAFRRSLRVRVTVAFAAFGTLVSLLLASGVFLAARDFDRRLLAETLAVELEDFIARRDRDPAALPPATQAIRTYVLTPDGPEGTPLALRPLEPGYHTVEVEDTVYYAAVAFRDRVRFYLLYDEARIIKREQWLLAFLAAGVLVMAGVSAGGGLWLAGRVVSPVGDLAARLSRLGPQDRPPPLAGDFAPDEVGHLASIFDQYLARIQAFIEREQAFTSDLSHELRTPLAIIQGAGELLSGEVHLKERTRRQVERITRAAGEMSELSDTLLALAREDERGSFSGTPTVVAELLKDVVESHRPLAADKPIEVVVETSGEPQLCVPAPVLRIVLGNLVRNAFAYTDRGKVRIRLEFDRFRIEDTGQGIAPEQLAHVFRRHYQGPDSPGAGIGLALVKRACEAQGWDIDVHSLPGRGTRVEVIFGNATQAT